MKKKNIKKLSQQKSEGFFSYTPESTIEEIISSEPEKEWATTSKWQTTTKKEKNKKYKFKKRRKIEIEGKNIIEKFFNVIAILWMDTPVGIVLSIALLVLFALIVGGMDGAPDGGPDFFTDTK